MKKVLITILVSTLAWAGFAQSEDVLQVRFRGHDRIGVTVPKGFANDESMRALFSLLSSSGDRATLTVGPKTKRAEIGEVLQELAGDFEKGFFPTGSRALRFEGTHRLEFQRQNGGKKGPQTYSCDYSVYRIPGLVRESSLLVAAIRGDRYFYQYSFYNPSRLPVETGIEILESLTFVKDRIRPF